MFQWKGAREEVKERCRAIQSTALLFLICKRTRRREVGEKDKGREVKL